MQHMTQVVRKWIVKAFGASFVALPVAAALRPEVQTVVLELAASACAFAVFTTLQTLQSMRELRHLYVLHASADTRELSQSELQSILGELHDVVRSVPEREPVPPRRRSTDILSQRTDE